MTTDDWNRLEQAIGRLSTLEKRRLIERLTHSLQAEEGATESRDEMTTEQRQAVMSFIEEMEILPAGDDPYADLGYHNDAHDRILYDLEQH